MLVHCCVAPLHSKDTNKYVNCFLIKCPVFPQGPFKETYVLLLFSGSCDLSTIKVSLLQACMTTFNAMLETFDQTLPFGFHPGSRITWLVLQRNACRNRTMLPVMSVILVTGSLCIKGSAKCLEY